MKDRARADLLLSAAEDLALLLAGTDASKALREMEPKGQPLATKAVEKLEEYAAGWPAGGSGAGGATNIVHDFEETCARCEGTGGWPTDLYYPPDRECVCPFCKGTGKITTRLTVPQHPDRTGEQVAAERPLSAPDSFVAPSVLDNHLREAARHLQAAAGIAAHAVVPTDATSKVRDDSSDWCLSCARVKDHKGRAFAVPSRVANGSVSRTPPETANAVAGAPLCDWCYGWVLAEKAWPVKGLIEARRDGKRITSKVLTKVMGENSPITKAAPV